MNREEEIRKSLDNEKYLKGDNLSNEEIEFFQNLNKAHTVTGETLKIIENDGRLITKIIVKGTWTPHGSIRDCGKYYIRALYSRYIKIDKETLKIIDYDCND